MLVFVSSSIGFAVGASAPAKSPVSNLVTDAAKAFCQNGTSPCNITLNYPKGQSFAPVKNLLTALGVKTSWDQDAGVLYIKNGKRVVKVKVGEMRGNIIPVVINGKAYNITCDGNSLKI